ncbi:MAG: glycosyltransferase family 4 protein [Acidobacteria bacterium]|nr:glycosyltransferase family 4 protein [Acidobacteriota bacterium]
MGDTSAEHGGIAPYAQRVLTSLVGNPEPGWRIVLLCAGDPPVSIKQLAKFHPGLLEIKPIPDPPADTPPRLLDKISARFNRDETPHPSWSYLQDWLARLELDLLHFPTQTLLHPEMQTPYSLTMYGVQELPHLVLPVPHIITMHDVQELHFPENFTPAQRAIRAVQYWKALEKAGAVVVSFDHVKQDLITYFGLPEAKVHVCPIPFRDISLQETTVAAAESYARKYEAWTPFLLYPAHTWRHKNHFRLLQALRALRKDGGQNMKLICTGGTAHHYHTEVVAQVAELGLSDAVLFGGIVPEDELRWLYRHAALVTIPTKYEAGSFPLFEAMLLGSPVICSHVTSLPETIGDRRFVFDPDDTGALTSLILRMLTDAVFRQENLANSAAQSERLRRVNAAAYFYDAYRQLLAIPPRSN